MEIIDNYISGMSESELSIFVICCVLFLVFILRKPDPKNKFKSEKVKELEKKLKDFRDIDMQDVIDAEMIKNKGLAKRLEKRIKEQQKHKEENNIYEEVSEFIDENGKTHLQISTDKENLDLTQEQLIQKYKELGYEVEIQVTYEKPKRSRRIPQDVKDKVWRRDEGRCVECGSNENLEFDHIIPHSRGGANTYRNVQLLCEPCNRTKSDKIG